MNRIATSFLLLATVTLAASGQVLNPPFLLNGTTITTSSGTYGNGAGLDEPNAGYSSLTVGAGTTISSGTATGGNDINPPGVYLIHTSTADFTNLGSVIFTDSDYNQSVVLLEQGALSVNVSNSGIVSTQGGIDNSQSDFYITTTTGNVTLNNTGTLSSVNGNGAIPVVVQSTSGNLAITNGVNATISAPQGVGRGIEGYTGGAGTFTVTNNGTITTGQDGIDVSTDSGALTVTNTGMITVTNNAILSNSNTGAITLFNSGIVTGGGVTGDTTAPITATNAGILNDANGGALGVVGTDITLRNSGHINAYVGMDFEQSGPGFVQIENSGTITAQGDGIAGYQDAGSPTTVTNSGTINSGGEGIYFYLPATVINSGTLSAATNAIDVSSGSTVILEGNTPVVGTILGGVDATSTSALQFKLSIAPANLAAAKTQLNSEIAAYAAQDGGDLAFTVDGLTFDVSNFSYNGGVQDDLIASRLYANTPGFSGLGGAIDQVDPTSTQGAALINALGNVSDADLPAALAELSPKALEVFRNVAFDNNTFSAAQINNHLANLRDGMTGFDSSALTVEDSSLDPSLAQVKSHLLAYDPASTPGLMSDSTEPIFGATDMKDMKSERVETMPTERWGSFISGNVLLANQSNNANLQDSKYTTGSVTAGVDYRLDEHFTVGALFAYSHTDADLDSRGSSATVDSYAPGVYASYVDGGWYGNGLASYVRNAYTEDRQVDIAGLSGDNHGGTDGNQGTANLTGGYEFHQGSFKFGPVASLQYVHLAIQSIQEQGPAALNIGSQDEDSLRGLLGFEARFVADVNTPLGPMSLTPHLSASWQHEYMDNGGDITSNFNGAGGGSFSTQTDSPERDSAFVDVGLDATVSKNVTVFVDYETQAGQADFFAQSAQGGVRVGF